MHWVARKEYQRLKKKSFEMEGFSWRKKELWNLAGEIVLQDRGAVPKEEGDVIRECQAMHEENFLSSRLREDGKNKEEWVMEVDKDTREEAKRG